jgi:hypothetical protein
MKSLGYIFAGLPKTPDDCIDFSLTREKPRKVDVERDIRESVSGSYIYKQLICHYIWHFPDRTIKNEEICGGCPLYYSGKKGKASMDRADRRLQKKLAKLSLQGIEVSFKENHFSRVPV